MMANRIRTKRPRRLTVETLEGRDVPAGDALSQIDHVVVVYQENWSFDALYGSFPGANGLQNAGPTTPQVDAAGNPLQYTPSPLNNGAIDPNFPSVIINGKSYLAFPAGSPNAGQPVPIGPYDLSLYIQPSQKTGDIVHKFYHEQLQIDNGNPAFNSTVNGSMDKFVAVSDNPGLVMSYFNATNLPEGQLAQQYTMDDNFFHAAYGGSFLNHQFLVAAQAPEWNQAIPNTNFVSHPAVDPTKTDGAMNAAGHDSNLTGSDLLAADGNRYVVNTTFSANLVPNTVTPGAATLLKSINDSNPNDPTRPYEQNIGDRLSGAGVSWKWYSGGWDAAVALQQAYASGDPNQIAAAKQPFAAGGPDNLFQWHHQPFAYFDNYAPLSPGGQAHLKDESNFFTDIANGTLPAVSFVKPLGPDNEHPGYASLLQGQQHVASIVQAIQANPDLWAHTAVVVTYDEHGGRWDHVTPPDANGPWGDGERVPGIVVSPLAKQHFVDHTQHDTLSILKTLETRFNLAPLTQYDAAASSLASSLKDQAAFAILGTPVATLHHATTTVTGKLVGVNGVVPTGSVSVAIAGTLITGSGTVNPDGTFAADLATGSLPVGAYTLTFSYAGDNNYLGTTGTSSLSVAYGFQNDTNLNHPVHSGATLPIKLSLIDDAGLNVGSPNVPVTALYLKDANGNQYAANSPGNSNPGGLFKYEPGNKQYQFNLKTTGLAAGTYTFYFQVGGDPTLHSFTFDVS